MTGNSERDAMSLCGLEQKQQIDADNQPGGVWGAMQSWRARMKTTTRPGFNIIFLVLRGG